MKPSRFRIAARHSDLARLQAYRVGQALTKRVTANPRIEIETYRELDPLGPNNPLFAEYNFRASLGDINLNDPLWKMPEKGVFTEDFVRDLLDGSADMVVHSWKDLPTHLRADTTIEATLPRADMRDLLLVRTDRLESVRSSGQLRILTSSPRRAHNLADFLRDYLPLPIASVHFENVRGNIPTRLKKLLAQDVDGLVVAKAAIDRLLAANEDEFHEVKSVVRDALSKSRFIVLPLSVNPTAAAQGALAVEIARSNRAMVEPLKAINCTETFECVEKERRILASYGGGCHQKIGVSILRRSYGEVTFLRGLTDAGEVLDRVELTPAPDSSPLAPPASKSAIFPREGEAASFFERHPLGRDSWGKAENETYLWVSRETAWPDGFRPHKEAIIWTAGLRTWKRLAERGVWVNGTSESLGEEESTRIETLVGLGEPIEIDWMKLTHLHSAEAARGSDGMRACAVYELVPKVESPDLKGRTHFFWMSGSSFDRAVALYPEIRGAHHACGPGSTYRHLRKALGPGAHLRVELGVESWRRRLFMK